MHGRADLFDALGLFAARGCDFADEIVHYVYRLRNLRDWESPMADLGFRDSLVSRAAPGLGRNEEK